MYLPHARKQISLSYLEIKQLTWKFVPSFAKLYNTGNVKLVEGDLKSVCRNKECRPILHSTITTFFSRSKYYSYLGLNLPVTSCYLLKENKRFELNLYKVAYNSEF